MASLLFLMKMGTFGALDALKQKSELNGISQQNFQQPQPS